MDLPTAIGRYDVVRLLGQGGMGRVLLARDSVLGRLVAIKILRDDLGIPPEVKDALVVRMRQEARAAATLSHPHMVTLHDMGEDDGVGLFLVFEYVDGPTLRDRLQEGPLAPAEVATLALELGGALSHAHAAGVIHRDVKPENVMLSPTGAKLTDFGIARVPDSKLTRAGAVLGTPAYSAPEALASSEFGPLSDQFSLAATLYEALTGTRAFPGDDAVAVASRVATESPAPLVATGFARNLSPRAIARIESVMQRALAKDPSRRYPSTRDLGEALAGALETIRATPSFLPTPVPRTSLVPRATRRWQNMIAGLAALLIAGLVVLGRHTRDEPGGVSLRAVASAFAAVIGAPHTAAGASVHNNHNGDPRPPGSNHAPSASAATSAGSADAAAPGLPSPSTSASPSATASASSGSDAATRSDRP